MIDWQRAVNGFVGAALATAGAIAVVCEGLGLVTAARIVGRWIGWS